MAYDHHVSRFQPPMDDDSDSLEEQILKFDESIGQRYPAAAKANDLFRAAMIARGLDPDAKPELSPELAAKMENDMMLSNEDIFFGDMNREFRGRQLRGKDYEFDE